MLTNASFEQNTSFEGRGGHVSVYLGSLTSTDTDFLGVEGEIDVTEYFGGAIVAFDAPVELVGGRIADLAVEHTGEDGTYGYCVQCDVEIPEKRLELLPHTPLCTNCMAAAS